jgi:hypothetical protein
MKFVALLLGETGATHKNILHGERIHGIRDTRQRLWD